MGNFWKVLIRIVIESTLIIARYMALCENKVKRTKARVEFIWEILNNKGKRQKLLRQSCSLQERPIRFYIHGEKLL